MNERIDESLSKAKKLVMKLFFKERITQNEYNDIMEYLNYSGNLKVVAETARCEGIRQLEEELKKYKAELGHNTELITKIADMLVEEE